MSTLHHSRCMLHTARTEAVVSSQKDRSSNLLENKSLNKQQEAGTRESLASQCLWIVRQTQWLSGLYCADFISFYSPHSAVRGGVGRENRILTNYKISVLSFELEDYKRFQYFGELFEHQQLDCGQNFSTRTKISLD